MSTPYERVSGMIARASGNRSSHHGDPTDNASTCVGMIECKSSNMISRHGNPLDNKSGNIISHHNKPTYGAITDVAVKLKTVYAGKNQ